MRNYTKYQLANFAAYVLLILCFPLNPLTMSGLLETDPIPALHYLGWVVWAFGMVFVIYPFMYFPRKGSVSKGKTYVHTTVLVDTGLYAVVRHVQYLGGIISVFIATPLLWQHWLFVVIGIPGAILLYWGTRDEDQRMIGKFGDDYKRYMEAVPAMDLLTGVIRLARRRKQGSS